MTAEQSPTKQGLQRRVWELVDIARPGDPLSKALDIFIIALIFLNVLAVILGTVKDIEARFGEHLHLFETVSVVIFTIEYLLRAWSCVAQEEYSHPVFGRLRFLLRPLALVDLLAFLPFYLSFITVDLRFLRAFRLLRVFRIAKLSRYSSSVLLFGRVIRNKKEELLVTLMVMFLLVVMSSSFIYYAEHQDQPDKFPDIPTAMWWSIVTLTTVGYGDVCPVTPLGKFFAGLIAILGIGMFALPTGIVGAAFVEEIQKQKSKKPACPHCGKEIA